MIIHLRRVINVGRNLRSNLNPNLFAGSGMPITQMEKDNLWDTSDDKIWDRQNNYVEVTLPSDKLLKDKQKLAELSGEVKILRKEDL